MDTLKLASSIDLERDQKRGVCGWALAVMMELEERLKKKIDFMARYEDERNIYSGISKGEFDKIADEISKKYEALSKESTIDIMERSIWIREQRFVKSIQHALGDDLPLGRDCSLDDAVSLLISVYNRLVDKCHSAS